MSVAIVVMAKAPLTGLAKTRLATALGAEGAAALARRMLVHAAEQAVAASVGPVEICATPDLTHEVFTALQQRFDLALHTQGDGDLGMRMHRAFVRHGGPLLLMGSDIPALDADLLRSAGALLATHDAVFVPAHDGGYALVGLRAPCAALFVDMAWSVPTVMAVTRKRLRAAGLRHAELPAVHDIDEAVDLVHLPASLSVSLSVTPSRENT
jgi:rSAM/selenodomain-associated transferase 1